MRRSDVQGSTTETEGICRFINRNASGIEAAFDKAEADGFPTGKGDPRSTDPTSSTERAALRNVSHPARAKYHQALRRMRSAAEEAEGHARKILHWEEHGTEKVAASAEVVAENEYRCSNPACKAKVPEGVKGGRCEACRSHKRRTGHERVPFGEEQGRKLDGTFASACQRCHSMEVAS